VAVEDLDAFWRDNSATAPHEQIVNNWILWASNLQNFVATPTVSPYFNPFAKLGLEEFRDMLERRVDFDKVAMQPEDSYPVLLVGAVDALSGRCKAFHSRHEKIASETILASAAFPTLFRSVRRHLLGWAILPEPTGQGACRRSARRDLGDPDKPQGDEARPQDGR